MENPARDIVPLVKGLISSPSPSKLRADIEAHFLPTAGFRHPLCYAAPGPRSRDAIIGIYAHYRAISPHTEGEVRVLAYDKDKNLLIIETIQSFHLFFSYASPAPSRLVTHITLSRDNRTGLHFIAYQEDFYHPDHFTNLLAPHLTPIVRFALKAAVVASNLLAPVGNILGLFADPPNKGAPHSMSLIPPIPPLRAVGRVLRAIDGRVRSRGTKWNNDDIVRTVPGEDELLLGSRT